MATPQVSHLLAESHGGEKVQWAAALIWSLCLPFTMFLMSSSNVVLLALQFVRGMAQGRKMLGLLVNPLVLTFEYFPNNCTNYMDASPLVVVVVYVD